MAEEGWRVNARGRRVPSRVTSNMRAFTGEKPKGGRDAAGRRYNRADGGTGRRVPVTSSGNRSVRVKSTRKNPGTGPTGGTRTSDVDRPSNVERRGTTSRTRYSGGRRVEIGPGHQPITSSRTRSQRVKQATNPGPTQGGQGQQEFKTGPSRVTSGYQRVPRRYIKPGTNEPIRKVDPPQYESSRRRSGQGRTNMTSPNAQKTNQRTGSSPMKGPGKPGSANDTGARRTGEGRRGQISSKGGPQTTSGYKPKMNQKGKVKANTVLKGVVSLLSKRFNHAMTAADIWKLGKTNSALDKALKRIPDTSDRDAGRLLGNKIASLATAAYNKVKGGSKTKAATPPPKKETKPKRQTKRLVKK